MQKQFKLSLLLPVPHQNKRGPEVRVRGGLSSRPHLLYSFPQRDKTMQSTAMKLEQRVNALERQLRRMKSEWRAVRKASRRPWWEQLAGRFKNGSLFDEIIEAGNAYRRSLTPRA